MNALLVPVDDLMEMYVYPVDVRDLFKTRGITNLVTVNFGTDHTEHGMVTFCLDESLPINNRATEITAMLTRGSYVRIKGLAIFTDLSEQESTWILGKN